MKLIIGRRYNYSEAENSYIATVIVCAKLNTSYKTQPRYTIKILSTNNINKYRSFHDWTPEEGRWELIEEENMYDTLEKILCE